MFELSIDNKPISILSTVLIIIFSMFFVYHMLIMAHMGSLSTFSYTLQQSGENIVTKAYVLYIRGTIDQGVKNHVDIALKKASEENAALILDVNSPGGFLGDTLDITDMILQSSIPVIGFASGDSFSGATLILVPTNILAVAPYAHIGDAQPVTIGSTGQIQPITEPKIINPLLKKYEDIASERGRNTSLIKAFILNATVINGVEAVEYHFADLNAVSLNDLVNKLYDKRVSIGGRVYVLRISSLEEAPECFTCTILSLLSDPTVSGLMITIAVFSIIFSISSGHFIGIPISLIFLFLGLIGSGFNVGLLSVIMILLGLAFLAGGIALGGSEGGILIIAGLLLTGLGGMFLPVIGREIMISGTEALVAGFYYASLGIGIGAGSVGAYIAMQLIKLRKIRHRIFEIIGKEGVAKDEITPEKEGFILIEGELWRAISDKDVIKPGERVVVINKKDFLLIVKKI